VCVYKQDDCWSDVDAAGGAIHTPPCKIHTDDTQSARPRFCVNPFTLLVNISLYLLIYNTAQYSKMYSKTHHRLTYRFHVPPAWGANLSTVRIAMGG